MVDTDADSPAALMRKVLDAFAAKDIDGMRAMLHDDIEDDFVAIGTFEGKDAVVGFFTALFAAIPDMELTIHRIADADDRVAFGQWSYTGTFNGDPFQGIEPTGTRIELRGIDVMEFDHGRLRRNTIYYDGLSFARQIGLLPAQGSPTERAMATSFNTYTRARKGLGKTMERMQRRSATPPTS